MRREEDHLFEYLNLLVSRPEVARALGARARAWVERECGWESVARRYASFWKLRSDGRTESRPRLLRRMPCRSDRDG